MKKHLLLCSALLGSFLYAAAQTSVPATRELQLPEAVLQGRSGLAPKVFSQLQWIPGTTNLAYVENDTTYSPRPAIRIIDAKTATAASVPSNIYLLDLLNPALKAKGLDTLRMIPGISFIQPEQIRFYAGKSFYSFNIQSGLLEELHQTYPGVEYLEWSADNKYLAEVFRDTIQVSSNYTSGSNEEHTIINGESQPITLGKAVHRNEFGINKGIFFAPDGKGLAYYAMDENQVTQYPIYNLHQKPAGYNLIRYPMAGATSHTVDVRYLSYKNGEVKNITIQAEKKKDDEYLTNIAFRPDGKELYIAHVNREQNEMMLKAYSTETGEYLKTLITEFQPKYVEPLQPMQFLPDGKRFIWFSELSGVNSIYLHDGSNKGLKQLTKEIIVLSVNRISPDGKYIYFTGVKPNSIDRHLFRTEVKSGKTIQVTQGSGTHQVTVNAEATMAVDNFTSLGSTRSYSIIDLSNNSSRVIFTAKNPLQNYNIGKVKISTLDNKGFTLFTRTVLPYNFDSTKKYPVVVYVYGGPHAQMITNTWNGGADLWMNYLANQGYIVFTLDNRGSDNRGRDFEQIIHRQLGNFEMEDQLAGVRYLKSLAYVDTARIGVHGWSYGGFMTTSLMTRQPGVFKVAVAGGPVMDWSLYEIMYTERYMDSPQENPEGYKTNALYQYIPQLKGKLLLIHGTDDDVVVWQHSLLYVEECVKQGKQLDYFVYPGHQHNVLGKDRVHLIRKVCDYFMDNL